MPSQRPQEEIATHPRTFLTAEWLNLLMLNYAVDARTTAGLEAGATEGPSLADGFSRGQGMGSSRTDNAVATRKGPCESRLAIGGRILLWARATDSAIFVTMWSAATL